LVTLQELVDRTPVSQPKVRGVAAELLYPELALAQLTTYVAFMAVLVTSINVNAQKIYKITE
jgi:hypothetical protein